MTTPDFVLALRSKVGHAPLWMPGCTAVVIRGLGGVAFTPTGPVNPADVEILVVRRADNAQWTPVTGIVDPGEEPADAAIREVHEETDTVARPLRMVSTEVVGPVTYANGDITTYLDSSFLCQWVSGEPRPADGENSQAFFVRGDQLPPMNDRFTRVIAAALSGKVETAFRSGRRWA